LSFSSLLFELPFQESRKLGIDLEQRIPDGFVNLAFQKAAILQGHFTSRNRPGKDWFKFIQILCSKGPVSPGLSAHISFGKANGVNTAYALPGKRLLGDFFITFHEGYHPFTDGLSELGIFGRLVGEGF
jgi:hypothetical protein